MARTFEIYRSQETKAARSNSATPAHSLSLFIILDDLGRPHMRLIRITSGSPQSLTLPQQVPALI